MAKVRPAKRRSKLPATRPGGVGCIILVCALLALFMFFMYFVLSHANG